jgi:uncharacterized protein YndB with AHSA1/START domain
LSEEDAMASEWTVDVEREVRREVELEAGPDEVWEAIADERLLSEWLADEVELAPIEGAPARFRDGERERCGTVIEVEEGRRLAFTWSAEGELPSEVELTVDAVAGGARLVIIERAIVGSTALAAPGWGARLDALAGALSMVAA